MPATAADAADRRLRLALANDFEVVVAGLASMLAPFADDVLVVDLAVDGPPRRTPIDVVLFDTYGRPEPEPERLREMVEQPWVANVAVYTFDMTEGQVRRALELGARGYLWKGRAAFQLVRDLRRIAGGEIVVSAPTSAHRAPASAPPWPWRERGLSRRESEVLALLIQGLSNRQIAATLHLGTESVKTHVSSLFRKLAVRNRVQAAALALDDPGFARLRAG